MGSADAGSVAAGEGSQWDLVVVVEESPPGFGCMADLREEQWADAGIGWECSGWLNAVAAVDRYCWQKATSQHLLGTRNTARRVAPVERITPNILGCNEPRTLVEVLSN